MNSEKHYNASYLADTGRLLGQIKQASYDYFAEIENAHIIDLGCGTGMDVKSMAASNSSNRYTGVDHDLSIMESADKSHSLSNLEFKLANADDLPFEDGSIAGIRAERLFQHLPDEPAVWKEILRIARPNAQLMVLETDWSSLNFYAGLKKEEEALIAYFTHAKVKNGLTANQLIQSCYDWGIGKILVEIYPIVLNSLSEANVVIKLEEMIEEAVSERYLSPLEGQKLKEQMAKMQSDGVFRCTLNMINLRGTIGTKT